MKQGLIARGIYEFEDPSGTLLAAKIPHTGSADLYDRTRVVVAPNQCAVIVYNGQITDVFGPGNHEIRTENTPILTRLANWKFGFESPLRAEIWFVSRQVFSGRRWGTASPILATLPSVGSVPLRAYGNFNVRIIDPKIFLAGLVGRKSVFDLHELEDLVQGQIIENLPKCLQSVKDIRDLGLKQAEISEKLEQTSNPILRKFGVEVVEIQVLSISPTKEILEALEERIAMDIVGDPRTYLVYKLANSLDALTQNPSGQKADPSQLMMSLMLSKGLLGDATAPAPVAPETPKKRVAAGLQCPACYSYSAPDAAFCSDCGKKL